MPIQSDQLDEPVTFTCIILASFHFATTLLAYFMSVTWLSYPGAFIIPFIFFLDAAPHTRSLFHIFHSPFLPPRCRGSPSPLHTDVLRARVDFSCLLPGRENATTNVVNKKFTWRGKYLSLILRYSVAQDEATVL